MTVDSRAAAQPDPPTRPPPPAEGRNQDRADRNGPRPTPEVRTGPDDVAAPEETGQASGELAKSEVRPTDEGPEPVQDFRQGLEDFRARKQGGRSADSSPPELPEPPEPETTRPEMDRSDIDSDRLDLEVPGEPGEPGGPAATDVPDTTDEPAPPSDRPEPDPERQEAARGADPFYREVMLTKGDVAAIEQDVDDRIGAGDSRPEDRDGMITAGRDARFEEKARNGEFFSPDIQGHREATDRNATAPEWYEDAAESRLFEVRPTPGTGFFDGKTAPQGRGQGVGADLRGGGDQVFIPHGGDRENWSVRPVARDAAEAERLGDDCVIGYDENGELLEPSSDAHAGDEHVGDHHAWGPDPFEDHDASRPGQRTIDKYAGSVREWRTASDDAVDTGAPDHSDGGGDAKRSKRDVLLDVGKAFVSEALYEGVADQLKVDPQLLKDIVTTSHPARNAIESRIRGWFDR